MNSIVLAIAERSPRGIAGGISRLITSGDLAPGDRLPTVRDLAAELGVSPATVSHAWQTLAAAGLIVSRGRSGSFVRSAPRDWMPHRYRGLDGHHEARLDLSRGTPDPELLPALGPALSRISTRADTSSYQQKPDIPELHDLLRDTWPSPVESITVTNGALDAIDRALASLVRYGDRIIVENPTFPPFLDLLDHHGLEPVGVGVDAEGMIPSEFSAALRARPAVVLLQPRAHNPTGASVSVERAKQLAFELYRSRFAADAIVIEDDHSGAISTAPEVTLATWLPERVLHVRSFSKTHGPDLRIGVATGRAPSWTAWRGAARPGVDLPHDAGAAVRTADRPGIPARGRARPRGLRAASGGFRAALRSMRDGCRGRRRPQHLVAGRGRARRDRATDLRRHPLPPAGLSCSGDAANPDGQAPGTCGSRSGLGGSRSGRGDQDALGGLVRVPALG
ncbi:MAG: aminotransferase class I/II-fold pyridoxal phosphate-dependent enzyme [Schumannella sp.]